MNKLKLIHHLSKFATAQTTQVSQQPEDGMDTPPDAPSRKITLVDEMVLLHKMAKKPATIVTVKRSQ